MQSLSFIYCPSSKSVLCHRGSCWPGCLLQAKRPGVAVSGTVGLRVGRARFSRSQAPMINDHTRTIGTSFFMRTSFILGFRSLHPRKNRYYFGLLVVRMELVSKSLKSAVNALLALTLVLPKYTYYYSRAGWKRNQTENIFRNSSSPGGFMFGSQVPGTRVSSMQASSCLAFRSRNDRLGMLNPFSSRAMEGWRVPTSSASRVYMKPRIIRSRAI